MRGPRAVLSPPMDFRIESIHIGFKKIQSLLQTNITILNSEADPITALINSGATSSFISPFLAEYLQLKNKKLNIPRKIKMLYGSNPQSLVTHYTKIHISMQWKEISSMLPHQSHRSPQNYPGHPLAKRRKPAHQLD